MGCSFFNKFAKFLGLLFFLFVSNDLFLKRLFFCCWHFEEKSDRIRKQKQSPLLFFSYLNSKLFRLKQFSLNGCCLVARFLPSEPLSRRLSDNREIQDLQPGAGDPARVFPDRSLFELVSKAQTKPISADLFSMDENDNLNKFLILSFEAKISGEV